MTALLHKGCCCHILQADCAAACMSSAGAGAAGAAADAQGCACHDAAVAHSLAHHGLRPLRPGLHRVVRKC